jgi:ADP-ribose pyrophosphatase
MNNPYRTVASRPMFDSLRFKVREDRVQFPDGREGPFAVVNVRGGVAVLAIDSDERVYLVREWKYALGRATIEVVCGAIDEGETPVQSAVRELREEAGVLAKKCTALGVTDPMTTFIQAPVHLFMATGLREVGLEPEPWEIIEPLRIPLAEAVDLVTSGEITHTPTALLLLLADRRIRAGGLTNGL